MRHFAVEDDGDDFHFLVGMRAKAGVRGDDIVIESVARRNIHLVEQFVGPDMSTSNSARTSDGIAVRF